MRLPSRSVYCRIVGTMLELEHTTLSTQWAWELGARCCYISLKASAQNCTKQKVAVQNAPFIYTVSALYTVTQVRIARKARWHVCSKIWPVAVVLLANCIYTTYWDIVNIFFCSQNSRVVWVLDCRLNLLWQCIPDNIHAPFMLQVGNTPTSDIFSISPLRSHVARSQKTLLLIIF